MTEAQAVRKSRRWAAFCKWIAGSLTGLFLLFLLADQIWPLPSPDGEFARIVLAEDGTPMWRFPDKNGIWRYPVRLEDVSPLYLEALLGYEDRWFYYHPGLNPMSILRAAWQNVRNQRIISGGSTITMQVARLIEPRERTFRGKLIEAWRTLQLEWHYSKHDILQIYINRAPFGGAQEGIGAACWSYLGKSPADLTPAEAALLAVLPQSPSRLRPDRYPVRAQKARDKVLNRLLTEHVWQKDMVDDALEEQIFLPPRQVPQLAPLFSMRVRSMSSERVIQTTIDASLQQRMENLVKSWRQHLPNHSSIAVLVVNSADMAVKSYVGSTGLDDEKRHGYVDMVTAIRSPGSTLKPFLYGLALDEGLIHSESLLLDVPRQDEQYRPGNFSQGYSGAVSASEALSRSLNIPAVELLEIFGPKKFDSIMRSHGLVMKYPNFGSPNLALILGGVGTTLESLVQNYSALARSGNVGTLRFFPNQPQENRKLLSPGAAWIIRLILTGEWQPDLVPDQGMDWHLAYKTGTSYGYRDAWAVGVNQGYVIGVWIGRPDGTPVAGQFGASTAVPLLHEVDSLLSLRPPHFPSLQMMSRPDTVSKAEICWPSGERKTETVTGNCRQTRKAWILDDVTPPTLTVPDKPTYSPHVVSMFVDADGKRVRPDCTYETRRELELWPAVVEPWLSTKEWAVNRIPSSSTTCPVAEPQLPELLRITGLRSGVTIHRQNQEGVVLHLRATGGGKQIYWFVDREFQQVTANNHPIQFTLQRSGEHLISVIDENGNTYQISFTLE